MLRKTRYGAQKVAQPEPTVRLPMTRARLLRSPSNGPPTRSCEHFSSITSHLSPLSLGDAGYQKRNTLPSPPIGGRGAGGQGVGQGVRGRLGVTWIKGHETIGQDERSREVPLGSPPLIICFRAV